jgi:hypothetical protein
MSWFGRPVHPTVDYAMRRHVTRFSYKHGKNKRMEESKDMCVVKKF